MGGQMSEPPKECATVQMPTRRDAPQRKRMPDQSGQNQVGVKGVGGFGGSAGPAVWLGQSESTAAPCLQTLANASPSRGGFGRIDIDLVDRIAKFGDILETAIDRSKTNIGDLVQLLELFHDQVFCFTPKGDLIALPKGATDRKSVV